MRSCASFQWRSILRMSVIYSFVVPLVRYSGFSMEFSLQNLKKSMKFSFSESGKNHGIFLFQKLQKSMEFSFSKRAKFNKISFSKSHKNQWNFQTNMNRKMTHKIEDIWSMKLFINSQSFHEKKKFVYLENVQYLSWLWCF